MDFFEIPDDYKPQKPLTDQEVEDITNYLKGHPLFLKELPQDIQANPHLAALQTMVEEEDPDVLAEGLNKQANTRIKQGPNSPYYMKDAYKKYTEAINLNPKTPELKAKLHCNRAAINLKFHNYGKVIQDCKISLNCDPKYIKAYYRMAKAYICLKKYEECIQLLANQTETELKALRQEAIALKNKQIAQKKKLQQKTHAFSNKIEQYFAAKKWRYAKKNEQLPQGVQIQFIDNQISIPLVIIYPEFNQFDLIAKSSEHQTITECISQLFSSPLPWDAKGEYKANTIEIFAEIEEAVLLKLPKQATISDVASRAPVRGAIELVILINNEFAAHYKSQYKIY